MEKMRKLSFVVLSLVIVAACSKKNKTDTPVEAAAPVAESKVDSTPMSFDAAGSDSGKIEGLNTVFFDYDKATLSGKSKKDLQGNMSWMKKNSSVKVQIEGHCDSRGSLEYNLALGERRANAVKSYLVAQGISESRISTISYGKEKPLVNAETEEAYSKNRRANFVPLQ